MDAKKFGAFISERRKEQHMTQAGLAGKIGVTDKAVSRWERGLGFPDINTMEPLATALGVALLELMKSEIISEEVQMKKDESAEKKYTSAEVTEMMYSMEEIRKQQQRQDKIAGYLAIPVMLIVAAIFKFSGHANFGGAVFAGLLGAGAIVCVYYLWENREDKESRKVYGFFTIVMTGIFLIFCSFMIPDGFWEHHKQEATLITCVVNLAIVVYMFGLVIKKINREKKNPAIIMVVAVLELVLVMWILQSFAARSIATQLLLNEKDVEEDWIRGYNYVQIDLHPDVYRVGFTYYANQKDVEIGKESVYGYDIQVDSEYMITIKEKSVAIGEDLWSKNTEVRKIKIQ